MYCPNCKKEVEEKWEVPYIKCTVCNTKLDKQRIHFHVQIGNQEITRRAVEDMYNEGMFSKQDYR